MRWDFPRDGGSVRSGRRLNPSLVLIGSIISRGWNSEMITQFRPPIQGKTVGGYDFEVVEYDPSEFPDVFKGSIQAPAYVGKCAWNASGITRGLTSECNVPV